MLVCERLHPHGQSAAAEELFQQKGEGPLRLLLDAEGGESAFGLYNEAACAELTQKFRAIEDGREKDTYVAVFGHAGFLHSVAYSVATAAGIDAEALERLLDIELGEAEGVLVPLYGAGKSAIHLKRPM